MALSSTFKDSILFETEETKSIEEAGYILKQGLAKYFSTMQGEREYEQARKEILNFTINSIKKYAYYSLKTHTFLEPYEVEQVKKALVNYTTNCEQADEFKQELLEDLTRFQHQIMGSQREKFMELINEKDNFEKQIKVLEYEKNTLVRERLAQIAWPYDAKTKKYDQQIAQLQAKVAQYTKKLENSKNMRPAANQKDILLYTMHLREKFAA